MKFRLLTLAVVLLLGAVVNIAVAWSLSLRAWNPEHERERSGPATQQAMIWWRTHVPVGHAGNAITLYESWCFGRRVEYLFNAKSGNDASVLVARAAHGWPLVSMERASWRDRARGINYVQNGVWIRNWRLIPLKPVLNGFAINTLFYAVMLWGLFAAPFALRRWRRIRRGLCPKCAYPVGTSEICTECGASLPR